MQQQCINNPAWEHTTACTDFVIRLLFVLFVLLHAVHFFLTCWTGRIDICRGAAECCSKASWFHSRCAAGARVDYKEQCGLVATSHTFIPGQRKGIKWKHSSLFVVIPSVRSHMNTLVELKPCHRSPTNFVSSLLTLLWTQWIICRSLLSHNPCEGHSNLKFGLLLILIYFTWVDGHRSTAKTGPNWKEKVLEDIFL